MGLAVGLAVAVQAVAVQVAVQVPAQPSVHGACSKFTCAELRWDSRAYGSRAVCGSRAGSRAGSRSVVRVRVRKRVRGHSRYSHLNRFNRT